MVLLNEDMTQALRSRGLTISRAHLLWELQRRGPVTQRVLADSLGVTPRAVTGLVDALVARDLVTREPHPRDRRAALVTFTRKGERLVARLERDHEVLSSALFAPMSWSELDGFARGLTDVIARLRTHLSIVRGPA